MSLPPASLACTICSEYYKPTDDVLCTSCGHVFHRSCYEDWQTRSLTCPDCRSAVPQTQRLYLHFEEHTEAERQLHQNKTELIAKITSLQRQLSESEANFIDALQALSAKEEQVKVLNNEVEFRKAQNESYEHELKLLKEKLTSASGGFDKNFYNALEGLKITGMEMEKRLKDYVDNSMDISPNMDSAGASSMASQSTTTDLEPDLIVAAEATKSIFATKFAPDTTELEIKNYIQEKLPNISDINVFKFPAPSFRRVCSFRITVPESVYDTIVQSNFWPEFTLVREFVERPRYVTLPELEHTEVL